MTKSNFVVYYFNVFNFYGNLKYILDMCINKKIINRERNVSRRTMTIDLIKRGAKSFEYLIVVPL